MKDGFGFENYTNMGVTNMTADELRRMFGDQVCGSMMGGCTLTPPAQQWMDEANKAMDGGHCFGFSHLALQLYRGTLRPADFGGASTSALAKDGNDKLQRELAYWMATQFVKPSAERFVTDLAPNDVLGKLRQAFSAGMGGEQYTLGIFKMEMGKRTGGHAVTPYAIADGNPVRLMVYDNNFPNQERSLEIDSGANSWKYTATINPSEPAGLYQGDATTKTLMLAPVSSAQGQQACPFCGNMMMTMMSDRQVIPNGAARVSVTDDQGRMVSDTANQIPGAETAPMMSADLFSHHEPLFRLPGGSDLTIAIDGSDMQASTQESVSVLGQGYTLAVEGVTLAPGQTDTLRVTKAGDQIRYRTSSMETPVVVLGVQSAGPDYAFGIRVSGDADGQEAVLRIDLQSGQLAVEIKDNANTTYGITIRRIDDGGVSEFTHAGATVGGNDTVYLDYAAWGGQGQPLTIEVDQGSDGTIDQTLLLSDDN
ncbi:MAG TPA: hypothetical protein VKN99_24625 [Polyangia bacterium]|nr:hypothetical protein [Polyangia bacterium]